MSTFPTHSQVVIIGGGIIGASVAYHLTKLGWRDVTLVERDSLACGTTWHSGAVIGQLRPTFNMTRLAQYTGQLLAELETETGVATGYKENGALVVTADQERFHELKRSTAMGRCFGLDVHTLTPNEAGDIWPLMNTDGLVGAVYLPNEGQTNPVDTTHALARGATLKGARLFEQTKVTSIEAHNDRISGVQTNRGHIACEYVVNCTGMWARALGWQTGVSIPLQAVEHMYVVTEPMPSLTPDLPSLRDHNQCIYFRVDAQQMLVGINEPVAKVWGADGIPDDFSFTQLPEDWEHFTPYMENALQLVPELANTGIRMFLSGPEAVTPDTRYLLGETPGLENHYVACGFSGVGVGSSGGAGKALAEWMTDGAPSMDLWGVDVRRMMPFQNNRHYLQTRVKESNGLLYAMHWPNRQHQSAREVRQSPIHPQLRERGACFGESAGWEVAHWFAQSGESKEYTCSWGKQSWFQASEHEHLSVRNGVGLTDLSARSRLRVHGEDATTVLGRLCANDLPTTSRIIRTPLLNERGGTEALVSLMNCGVQEYLLVDEPTQAVRNHDWLLKNIIDGERVCVDDVSGQFAEFVVAGPLAASLLADRHDGHPPELSAGLVGSMELGMASVRIWQSHETGETGFHILMPAEFARGVLNVLLRREHNPEVSLIGWHAWRSLCMEAGYKHWGEVIGDSDSPLDAGLGNLLSTTRDDYIGAQAARTRRGQTQDSQLLNFRVLDASVQLYHDEPVLLDGRLVGYLLIGRYGHSIGAALGQGYVTGVAETANLRTEPGFEIDVAGVRYPAKASTGGFLDHTAN